MCSVLGFCSKVGGSIPSSAIQFLLSINTYIFRFDLSILDVDLSLIDFWMEEVIN